MFHARIIQRRELIPILVLVRTYIKRKLLVLDTVNLIIYPMVAILARD